MKEFSHPLTIQASLRKSQKNQLNKAGNYSCFGFRLGPVGLEHYSNLSALITDPLGAQDWPFPQLFNFAGFTFLLTKHYLYTVDSSWALTQGPAWFHSGDVWDAADFHTFVAFTNGTLVILRDPSTGDYYFPTEAQFPNAQTICNFYGQLVLGNTALGQNWVQWSNIGEATFTWDRRNIAGGMPMDWSGEVLRLLVLGNKVVVYGEDGITELSSQLEPIPAFGKKNLASFGIASKGAVASNGREHWFIDDQGYLRKYSSEGMSEGEYQEYFEGMLGTDIVMSYNPGLEEIYICNETRSFVLTQYGLTEIPETISGCAWFVGGETVAITKDLGSLYKLIITNPFDFGYRARKTITQVDLPFEDTDDVMVAVDWRNGAKDSWSRTSYAYVNSEGIAHIPTSGAEFRLAIRMPIASDGDLSGDLLIHWKADDKRFTRGTNVSNKGNSAASG